MELIKSSGLVVKVPMFKGFKTEFKGLDIGSTINRMSREKQQLNLQRYGDIKRLPFNLKNYSTQSKYITNPRYMTAS